LYSIAFLSFPVYWSCKEKNLNEILGEKNEKNHYFDYYYINYVFPVYLDEVGFVLSVSVCFCLRPIFLLFLQSRPLVKIEAIKAS